MSLWSVNTSFTSMSAKIVCVLANTPLLNSSIYSFLSCMVKLSSHWTFSVGKPYLICALESFQWMQAIPTNLHLDTIDSITILYSSPTLCCCPPKSCRMLFKETLIQLRLCWNRSRSWSYKPVVNKKQPLSRKLNSSNIRKTLEENEDEVS